MDPMPTDPLPDDRLRRLFAANAAREAGPDEAGSGTAGEAFVAAVAAQIRARRRRRRAAAVAGVAALAVALAGVALWVAPYLPPLSALSAAGDWMLQVPGQLAGAVQRGPLLAVAAAQASPWSMAAAGACALPFAVAGWLIRRHAAP